MSCRCCIRPLRVPISLLHLHAAFGLPCPVRSITQLVYRNGKREWDAQFPAAAGWKAAPLGVSGNDIQVKERKGTGKKRELSKQDLPELLGAPRPRHRAAAPRLLIESSPLPPPQDLAWRVIGGWERPRLAPACVALLIGTNNVSGEMPPAELAQKVNYLIQYFRKVGWR